MVFMVKCHYKVVVFTTAQKAGERTEKTNYLYLTMFSDTKLNKIGCT